MTIVLAAVGSTQNWGADCHHVDKTIVIMGSDKQSNPEWLNMNLQAVEGDRAFFPFATCSMVCIFFLRCMTRTFHCTRFGISVLAPRMVAPGALTPVHFQLGTNQSTSALERNAAPMSMPTQIVFGTITQQHE